MTNTAGLQQLSDLVSQNEEEEYTLSRLLNDALTEKMKQSPLLQQREQAMAQAYSAPERAFQQYAQPQTVTIGGGQAVAPGQNPVGEQETVENVYLPPSAQRRLVSEQTGTAVARAGAINDLLALQYGGAQDFLEKFTNALKARTESAKGKFQRAIDLGKLRMEATKTSQEQEEKLKKNLEGADKIKLTIDKLNEVDAMLNQYQGQDVSGLMPGLKTKFGSGLSRSGFWGKLFAPSLETVGLGTTISNYNTALFDIAGKAFTGPEKALLQGLILNVGDDEETMKRKIQQGRKILQNKLAEEINNL